MAFQREAERVRFSYREQTGIREKPSAKIHDETIFDDTRGEASLLAILAVVVVFLSSALPCPSRFTEMCGAHLSIVAMLAAATQ